jgi:cell fate regulator YaaT (PSP1 superfamily)
MPDIVGVRFKPCGKIYDFEADGVEVNKGDCVVVESELGLNLGSVVTEPHSVESLDKKFKKIVRKATEEDLIRKKENERLEIEARDNCLERIMARGLPMKLIGTEATLDKKRIIFYFTADKRIDFRELVKDLASRFKTRIEMRQIGVRDSARIIGSLGICGRELCCARFLTSFEPISIKMAKKQELVLNTNKLSGSCGRLMCCLGFEYSEIPPGDTSLPDVDTLPPSENEENGMIVISDDTLSGAPGPVNQLAPVRAGETEGTQPAGQQTGKRKGKRRKWHPRRRRRKHPNK